MNAFANPAHQNSADVTTMREETRERRGREAARATSPSTRAQALLARVSYSFNAKRTIPTQPGTYFQVPEKLQSGATLTQAYCKQRENLSPERRDETMGSNNPSHRLLSHTRAATDARLRAEKLKTRLENDRRARRQAAGLDGVYASPRQALGATVTIAEMFLAQDGEDGVPAARADTIDQRRLWKGKEVDILKEIARTMRDKQNGSLKTILDDVQQGGAS
jgi:hypothetical protein